MNCTRRTCPQRELPLPLPSLSLRSLLTLLALMAGCSLKCAAGTHEVLKVSGERFRGTAQFSNGTWSVGKVNLLPAEIIAIRFSAVPAPRKINSGIFLRDGSLLTGNLETIRKGKAKITAPSFGKSIAELPSVEVAGAFFPPLSGQQENFPAVGRYALLRAGMLPAWTIGKSDASGLIQPGRRNRIMLHNLDPIPGRLIFLRSKTAFVEIPGKTDDQLSRASIRLIELKTPPAPAAPSKETALGSRMAVRLKAGDVIIGRIRSLNDKSLVLLTSFAGDLTIPLSNLSMLYPVGDAGTPVRWLSGINPAKSKHVPMFDAVFPARGNLSCDRNGLSINGEYCDLGIGTHSQAELSFALTGKAGKKFVSWVGIDDETNGRGSAIARVLLDGKEAWNSDLLKPNTPPKPVSVDLGTARNLTLRVEFGPQDDDSGDHVDWGWAAIVGK